MISGPGRGCRGWLAISGAVDVPIVLGSRGTDLRANLGGLEGRALRDGDTLPLGNNSELSRVWLDHLRAERIASWSAPATWSSPHRAEPILQIIPGSDWDRFTDSSRRFLIAETFVVSSDSDRMGARLEGPALKTNEEKDLTSEAVVPGTIQVPPSGLPIILLGDCQTIGGYPKIAHVITVDLAIAAQLCPGSRVRFAEVSIMSAHELLLERETEFERFRLGLTLRGS
jgi:antagonist of KipI